MQLGETVQISFPADTLYGQNGMVNQPVSNSKIFNRVIGAGEDGKISVKQILSSLTTMQDADGNGIFDKADVVIWLQYIQSYIVE